MGVLYHTRHPLLALERVASVTKEMAIIETATDMLDVDRPAMAFYPTTEFGSPNAWCGPNPACVEVMLKTAGFKKVISYSSTRLKYRIPHETLRTNHPKKNSIPTTRAVFHAYK